MYKIFTPFIFIFLASCGAPLHYIGQRFTPSTHVDVYVAEQSIIHPYKIIGKAYLGRLGLGLNPEKIQRFAEKKGKVVGADAVLIYDFYVPNSGGAEINTAIKTDSVGNGIVSTGSTTITPTTTSGFNILFIKYNN